jgi:hypothetical protein
VKITELYANNKYLGFIRKRLVIVSQEVVKISPAYDVRLGRASDLGGHVTAEYWLKLFQDGVHSLKQEYVGHVCACNLQGRVDRLRVQTVVEY